MYRNIYLYTHIYIHIYIYIYIYVKVAQWGGVEGVVAECGSRVLKTVRPSSVSVHLGTPIQRARAIFRPQGDKFVPRSQPVIFR